MNLLIIGMPNTGKTSLFNLITANNQNIIHKTVGTTRDWHVSSLNKNTNIKVYDTPGIIINKNNTINKNIIKLIDEINIFIYVIDYKLSNYSIDKLLINSLRKYNKKIILIINKDDNLEENKNVSSLGIQDIFYLSCSHKLGFDNLFNFIENLKVENKPLPSFNYSIGLFGKTNVGKSTLFNKLVGFDRSLVSNIPKTTTDIVSSSYIFKGNNYSIKDTAGLIKKNKIDKESLDYYTTKKTLSIIKDIDINLFLIDVEQGFDNQSKKIFNLIYKKSNIILFLINKSDLLKTNKKTFLIKLKNEIEREFSQSKNLKILPTSNLYLKDIKYLKNYIHKLTSEIRKNISTSQINLWLKKIVNKYSHPRIKGKDVKFKYATQISSNPLTIKIFSNFSKEISPQYKKYLLNNFYIYFKIKSKNIKIVFSKSTNPFQ